MYSVVSCAIVQGIDSRIVRAETDISSGMPVFDMVGFLSAEVKEARERVRTALRNCGYDLPIKRITVNISPASIRKHGTGFDLPVAVSVLAATDVISSGNLEDTVMIGEMGLNGRIYEVNGVLPMVLAAAEAGKNICIVPAGNYDEARMVPDMEIVAVSCLKEVVTFLNEGTIPEPKNEGEDDDSYTQETADFCDVNGQRLLKRACEIAAAGLHNLLMIGPPGSGKSFVAKCLPSILPPLTEKEQLDLCKIYSVCGEFYKRKGQMTQRPFRSPHHTVTNVGLSGGGSPAHPGEISLAHRGILFLDELTEFRREVIESLRQPLEEKRIILVRESGSFEFPADFMLVAAMNPCKCGYYPDMSRCHCTSNDIRRYFGRLSQPMLDRIDICVEAPRLSFDEIVGHTENESSETIRGRVMKAHEIQKRRFESRGESFTMNSQIPVNEIPVYCSLGKKEEKYMESLYSKLHLTARTYHRLLRVARTIADLDGSERIKLRHLEEVVCYRGMEHWDWDSAV